MVKQIIKFTLCSLIISLCQCITLNKDYLQENYENLDELTVLDLSGQHIDKIDSNTFISLPFLRTLILNDNQILLKSNRERLSIFPN